MRYRWPENTPFTRVVLSLEQEVCSLCERRLHVCDHRFHRVFSLQGPPELIGKLAHCPDPACPAHSQTLSPLAETPITLPWRLIAWDVFCWLGFRRFARHWSIPQLQAFWRDSYHIPLSDDALSGYLTRYRCMVAARHQDAAPLAQAYQDIDELILTIDGIPPEKGHEAPYVVRALCSKRIWFAEALLSSGTEEVRRLLAKAKDWARQLNRPVALGMPDKPDAFVKGIEAEFPDVPHRYRGNHFLRDVAKPVPEADSHAKVQMGKGVRGLRDIEKQVLEQRRRAQDKAFAASAAASQPLARPAATARDTTAAAQAEPAPAPGKAVVESVADAAGQVVLDYCAAVRGILNDDQGGPLHPPGLRMAEALQEVSESLQRNLDAQKGGAPRSSCASPRAASPEGCKPSRPSRSRSRGTSNNGSESPRRWTQARAATSSARGGCSDGGGSGTTAATRCGYRWRWGWPPSGWGCSQGRKWLRKSTTIWNWKDGSDCPRGMRDASTVASTPGSDWGRRGRP